MRERERVCVCAFVREGQIVLRECVRVCVREREEIERKCVYMCVCVCARERKNV